MRNSLSTVPLLDQRVTLSTFDAWAKKTYRANGRNHRGLFTRAVLVPKFEGLSEPLLSSSLPTDAWPGNTPAEVHCALVAFNYAQAFHHVNLAARLMDGPFTAVDLRALHLGAEVSKSDAFVKHVERLTTCLRYRFGEVCAAMRSDDENTVLTDLDREALSLSPNGQLEERLSKFAIDSGKLRVASAPEYMKLQHRLDVEIGKQLETVEELFDLAETTGSLALARDLAGRVGEAFGQDVDLCQKNRVDAAYYLPAPPPELLIKYHTGFAEPRVEVLLVPASLTAKAAEAWVYRDRAEYGIPELRLELGEDSFKRLSRFRPRSRRERVTRMWKSLDHFRKG